MTPALSPAERGRLVRLLGMQGSDHPGEVANAGSLAAKMLRARNLAWDQVVADQAVQPYRPPPRPAPGSDVRADLEAARAELRAAADAVQVATALAMLPTLAEAEAEAGRLRAVLVGFLNSRTAADGPLPWPVQEIAHDQANALLLARAPPGAADPGRWPEFRKRLMADPGAALDG